MTYLILISRLKLKRLFICAILHQLRCNITQTSNYYIDSDVSTKIDHIYSYYGERLQ